MMATLRKRQIQSSKRKLPMSQHESLRKRGKHRKPLDEIFGLDLKDFRKTVEDYDIQQKIDFEIKMRDGITKIIAACSNDVQSLEASRGLVTSNARMMAYMAELQRRRTLERGQLNRDSEDAKPCKATLAISDIRIPLMWKEEDHIKNKGDHRRYSVFCLWKIGTEIYDTEMIRNVDRTLTDMCPEDVLVFNDISPDFECVLEVYCYNMHNDLTIASTPKRIRKKLNTLSSTMGRSMGKKVQSSMENGESSLGVKFTLIATAKLNIEDIGSGIKTHNLVLENTENSPVHLPLFGHFCCRLGAQPDCMVQDVISGYLSFQGATDWTRKWSVLNQSKLQCWTNKSDSGIKKPDCIIAITKGSNIAHRNGSTMQKPNSFLLTCLEEDKKTQYTISADSKSEKERWISALEQQFVDTGAWQQACTEFIDIKSPTPKRPQFPTTRKGSLYDATSLKGTPDNKKKTHREKNDRNEDNALLDSPAANTRSKSKSMPPKAIPYPKPWVVKETGV